jgi:hypothetical protein
MGNVIKANPNEIDCEEEKLMEMTWDLVPSTNDALAVLVNYISVTEDIFTFINKGHFDFFLKTFIRLDIFR